MLKRIALIATLSLSGCALNPLDALSTKPEMTAQVGSENTKQLVGATVKKTDDIKQDNAIKADKVGNVDQSVNRSDGKLQAGTINAERVIVNDSNHLACFVAIVSLVLSGAFLAIFMRNRK